jgi:hypothetical protein
MVQELCKLLMIQELGTSLKISGTGNPAYGIQNWAQRICFSAGHSAYVFRNWAQLTWFFKKIGPTHMVQEPWEYHTSFRNCAPRLWITELSTLQIFRNWAAAKRYR